MTDARFQSDAQERGEKDGTPTQTSTNFPLSIRSLILPFGTLHKGRPQNFRVFGPPPLSKFWIEMYTKSTQPPLCAIHKGRPQGGGRGGSRIAQFCGQTVLIGCVKCGRGGGGCQKSQDFCGRPLCMVPNYSHLGAAQCTSRN